MTNYFELYEIPISFTPDASAIRQKFLILSRRHHPDYFSGATGEAKEQALQMSATINKGAKVFADKEATLQHVLEIKGLLSEDEKVALPPEFLMEMMDINEAAEEAGTDPEARAALLLALEEMEAEIYLPVAAIIENYEDGAAAPEALLKVKDYYFKKKYLARLRSGLAELA